MFILACPTCSKERTYATKGSLERASLLNTSCYSCRTVSNNKKRKGTKGGENNPAWKGYGCIPGKVFSRLKRNAEIRNISFDLTIEDIHSIFVEQQYKCAFTGFDIFFDGTASIDRIDSDKGYTVDNIQIVHKDLNMMKKDLPNDVFILWCKSVANFNTIKKE